MATAPPVGGLLPAVRETQDGYVAWSPPLTGKEEGKRAQARGEVITAGRVEVCALPVHRFQKHSDPLPVWQRGGRYTFCSLTR